MQYDLILQYIREKWSKKLNEGIPIEKIELV